MPHFLQAIINSEVIMDAQWSNTYFERGVDTKNRRVFVGEIDTDSAFVAVQGLYYLDTISDEPIELFICSPGGCVYSCLAIYDILQTLKAPVHTFAFGLCMSAAPLLLAAGEPNHRWVSGHCSLMTHAYADIIEGRGASLKVDLEHGQALDDTWNRLLAQHSSKDFKFWKSKSSRTSNFYFGAEQAIGWGLADAVWSER